MARHCFADDSCMALADSSTGGGVRDDVAYDALLSLPQWGQFPHEPALGIRRRAWRKRAGQ